MINDNKCYIERLRKSVFLIFYYFFLKTYNLDGNSRIVFISLVDMYCTIFLRFSFVKRLDFWTE